MFGCTSKIHIYFALFKDFEDNNNFFQIVFSGDENDKNEISKQHQYHK